MKKLLVLFLSLILIVFLASPVFADEVKFMPLPEGHNYMVCILPYNGSYYAYGFDSYEEVGGQCQVTNLTIYVYKDDAWVFSEFKERSNIGSMSGDYLYDNTGVLNVPNPMQFYTCDGSSCPSTDLNKDNICDDCRMQFTVLRDYDPFSVKKFMNHIGQIFTSAVRWVGDVGAAILAQPLLLAFTALPLCGLGIAVFRRLKETV